MSSPLGDDDRERIHAAVAEIERREGIDVAVILTRVSDRYALHPLIWAAVLAFAALAILAVVRPRLPLPNALLIQLLVLAVSATLLDLRPIRLRLVPKRLRDSRAHQLAHREFAAHTLAGEPGRGVILFFASIGERYFEIIGDKALHARISDSGWEAIVVEFTSTAGKHGVANALLAAIIRCGAMLRDKSQGAS